MMSLIDLPASEAAHVPLMKLYVDLGLHTNSAAVTDKNGQRYNLMKVMRALWADAQLWRQLQSLALQSVADGAGDDGFGVFVETLVKENIFLLNDALGRLADVKGREDEMADEEAWAKQPARQRQDRERRLDQVKRTARGFLD